MTAPIAKIECENQPACIVCGSEGAVLYSDMRDRLFDVPGRWTVKKCRNPECRFIWLDPRPTQADVGKAYVDYYTHDAEKALGPQYLAARRGYLADRFGYDNGATPAERWRARLARLYPGRAAEFDFSVLWLPASARGRLLDIGCGDGWLIRHMNALGWSAEGVDFDPRAVAQARGAGLTVHQGSLFDQRFHDASFDAITMSHSIEHVHDPVAWLAECRRVLRPGGQLILVTPNSESLAQKWFGAHCLALDPPRHLYLFNRDSLERVAERAELRITRTFTSANNANNVFIASRSIQRTGHFEWNSRPSFVSRLTGRAFLLLESTLMLYDAYLGENLVVIATR